MLNFDFLEKGLGIVSPPHFVLFISQGVTSYILELTLFFQSTVFSLHEQKVKTKI